MNNDRQLLEKAAKAVGIEVRYQPMSHRFLTKKQLSQSDGYYFAYWDPLTDDGDALRLAVKLKLTVLSNETSSWIAHGTGQMNIAEELHKDDPYAATRRVIVRAAASIGESMI